MNNIFHFIFTDNGQSSVEADIPVDLTDGEILLIQQNVNPDCSTSADEQIRRKLNHIYRKIRDAGYPMCQCSCCQQIRLLQMGNDIAWQPVDYEALLRNDIEEHGFVPHDEQGHPYIGEELQRQWVRWENERLSSSPYSDQLRFYQDRYHFAVDGVLDEKGATLRFTIPETIPLLRRNGWWHNKMAGLRRWLGRD